MERMVPIDDHTARIIEGCLAKQLVVERRTLELLMFAKERELLRFERCQLPSSLRNLDRAQLTEQVDAWITYVQYYEAAVDQFNPGLWAVPPVFEDILCDGSASPSTH